MPRTDAERNLQPYVRVKVDQDGYCDIWLNPDESGGLGLCLGLGTRDEAIAEAREALASAIRQLDQIQ